MAIHREYSLQPNPQVGDLHLSFSPFHDGKLIAATDEMARAGVIGVYIENAKRHRFISAGRLMAIIASPAEEQLSFWIKSQDPRDPVSEQSFNTQKATIEFIYEDPLDPFPRAA